MIYKKGQRVLILDGEFAGKVGTVNSYRPENITYTLVVRVKEYLEFLSESEVSAMHEPSSTWPELYKLTGFLPEGVNIAR